MDNRSPGSLPDIRRTIEINAPIEKVWQAVSTSEGLANWLMPNNLQPAVGYEFTLHSQFGAIPCKVLELKAPTHLSFAWDDFGWIVSFELKDLRGTTEFTVVHAGWGQADEIVPRAAEKHSVIRERMNIGWEHLTAGLRNKLGED